MAFKSLVTGIALSVFLMCGTSFAAEKTFINGIDANYPPHAFLDEKGKPSGFDVEAMNWIAKKMGFKVEHKAMDWDGIVPSLLAKKIDMVCSGMSMSPERKTKVTFSDPYWSIRKYFLVNNDSTLTKDQLLTGKKVIGVQSGTNEAEYLKAEAAKAGWNYTLKFYESPPLAIEDLMNKRIDAAAIDSAPADEAIHKAKNPIKVIGEFAEPDDFGVAMRNEDTALHKLVNEGFKLLKADPYWETLKAKYIVSK